MLCVRLCIVRVSIGLVWLVSFVYHYWVEKRRCLYGFDARFLITADRENCSNFVWCKSISPNRLGRTILYKAFVRLRLLNNRYSITFSTKTNASTAVSANPTKNHSKTPRSSRHEQSIPPIMKNVRYNAQRNLLKRKRYRPEHS